MVELAKKKLCMGDQQKFFQTIDSVTIKGDRSEIDVAFAGDRNRNPTR